METRSKYSQHINEQNLEGSNRASSYIRALDLLSEILSNTSAGFSQTDIWSVRSVREIDRLYDYVIEQQKLGDDGIFSSDYLPSYWQHRFYSAALKTYKQFLILNEYETELWDLYADTKTDPSEFSEQLSEKEDVAVKDFIQDDKIDFSSREGKEYFRETKRRVNQNYFRKMMLATYENQCCVTGLNIPEVLRASHIVAWSEDEKNRLNPTNGLCLSATYDAAFDRFLISFDEDYRMILSPSLREYYSNAAFQKQFKAFEGSSIAIPKRFRPDQSFLQQHRERME